MRGLSLRQPWAFAVLYLGKRIENRIWRHLKNGFVDDHCAGITRGENVALHASKSKPQDYDWDGVEHAIGRRLTEEEQDLVDVQRGHVIGTMHIVDILRTDAGMTIVEGDDEKFPHYRLLIEDIDRYTQHKTGDALEAAVEQLRRWWLGPYAFALDDVHGLTVPQAAKGALGFWELGPELEQQVRHHVIPTSQSDMPRLPSIRRPESS